MDVSVIVPFYKGNKYINNILRMVKENVANANEITVEVVVVNDSPEIEIQYEKDLVDGYFLNIVRHKKNMGIQQARITGINVAQGKYVLMLDQDDEIIPNTIKTQFDLIGDNAAILSNGYSENSDGIRIELYKNKKQMSVVNNFSYYFCHLGFLSDLCTQFMNNEDEHEGNYSCRWQCHSPLSAF